AERHPAGGFRPVLVDGANAIADFIDFLRLQIRRYALPLLGRISALSHDAAVAAKRRLERVDWRLLPALALRRIRRWWRLGVVQARALRMPPRALALGATGGLVAGYLLYCLLSIPAAGGLAIEPTPSAVLVEANRGELFATRGVFKGEKL